MHQIANSIAEGSGRSTPCLDAGQMSACCPLFLKSVHGDQQLLQELADSKPTEYHRA